MFRAKLFDCHGGEKITRMGAMATTFEIRGLTVIDCWVRQKGENTSYDDQDH